MDKALNELEKAIENLFALRQNSWQVIKKQLAHVTCAHQLPKDWYLLYRYPIWKRFVVDKWARMKLQNRVSYDKQVWSLILLCLYLYRCEILNSNDQAFANTLIQAIGPNLLKGVLQVNELPLQLRLILLNSLLSRLKTNEDYTKDFIELLQKLAGIIHDDLLHHMSVLRNQTTSGNVQNSPQLRSTSTTKAFSTPSKKRKRPQQLQSDSTDACSYCAKDRLVLQSKIYEESKAIRKHLQKQYDCFSEIQSRMMLQRKPKDKILQNFVHSFSTLINSMDSYCNYNAEILSSIRRLHKGDGSQYFAIKYAKKSIDIIKCNEICREAIDYMIKRSSDAYLTHLITSTTCKYNSGMMNMWKSAWMKEFSSYLWPHSEKLITLKHIILVCCKLDAIIWNLTIQESSHSGKNHCSPGYVVFSAIARSKLLSFTNIIYTIEEACHTVVLQSKVSSECSNNTLAIHMNGTLHGEAIKNMLYKYMWWQVLGQHSFCTAIHSCTVHAQNDSSKKDSCMGSLSHDSHMPFTISREDSDIQKILLLQSVYNVCKLCNQWKYECSKNYPLFNYLLGYSITNSNMYGETCANSQEIWFISLTNCIETILSTAHYSQDLEFYDALQNFVCQQVSKLIMMNGESIINNNKHGEGNNKSFSQDKLWDRKVVERHIITIFGILSVKLVGIILRNVYNAYHLQSIVNTEGMHASLLPALEGRFKQRTVAGSSSHDLIQYLEELLTSIDNANVENNQLKASINDNGYLQTIIKLRFCASWDEYYSIYFQRYTSTTSESVMDPAIEAFVRQSKLTEFLKLLETLNIAKSIGRESVTTINFLARAVDKFSASEVQSERFGRLINKMQGLKQLSAYAEGMSKIEIPMTFVVSYSNAGIQKLIKELFEFPELQLFSQIHKHIKELYTTHFDVNFTQLLICIRRWLAMCQKSNMQKFPVEFGQETRVSLVLLANKLLFWLCDDSNNELCKLFGAQVRPKVLDEILAYTHSKALPKVLFPSTGHSGESAPFIAPTLLNTLSSRHSMSNFRVKQSIQMYIMQTDSILPNLIQLSNTYVDAVMNCPNDKVCKDILGIIFHLPNSIMMEVVIERIKSALESASSSINELKNLFQFIMKFTTSSNNSSALSTISYPTRSVMWTKNLFSLKAIEVWLNRFYKELFVSSCDSRENTQSEITIFLEHIEESHTQGIADLVFTYSYTLLALFCTFLFNRQDINHSLFDRVHSLGKVIISNIIVNTDSVQPCAINCDREKEELLLLFYNGENNSYVCNKVITTETGVLKSHELAVVDANFGSHTYLELLHSKESLTQSPRLFLTFSAWFRVAARFSHQFTPTTSTLDQDFKYRKQWEGIFTHQILYLYLPIEFNMNMFDLLTAWMTSWLQITIHSDTQLSDIMLDEQKELFYQLSNRNGAQSWKLLCHCLLLVVNQVNSNTISAKVERHIETAVQTFGLMTVSRIAINQAEITIKDLCTSIQILAKNLALHIGFTIKFCALKYLLELTMEILVGNTATFSQEKWINEVEDFQKCLHDILTPSIHEETTENFRTLKENFILPWLKTLQLKFDFIDSHRCHHVISIISQAFELDKL